MIHVRVTRFVRIGAALALALGLMFVITGCGGKTATAPSTSVSAKSGLSVATSALSTTAPEAKLLVVQTPSAVSSTSTPVWSYLFGSPKTSKTYMVYVQEGKVVQSSEYGTAELSAAEWTAVPPAELWKTDSDVAYKKAVEAAKASTDAAYTMGFLTFVPPTGDSTAKPFVWYVSFDPATSGATTGTVLVDAKTGALVGP